MIVLAIILIVIQVCMAWTAGDLFSETFVGGLLLLVLSVFVGYPGWYIILNGGHW